jgi:hypothetical protein
MANSFNPARAARYEVLAGRIEALVKQLEPVARTKPGQEVSAPVRSLAEDLLFEAREFRARGERRGLVAAAPDYAGLFVQLGQALAMLERWRARNPASGQPPEPASDGADIGDIRRKLALRIERHEAGIFDAGRRAALAEIGSVDQELKDSYPRIPTTQ